MAFTYVVTDGSETFTWDVQGETIVDKNTGIGTQTITPNGGLSRLPFIVAGESGPPPIFDSASRVVVAPGETVPPPEFTLVSPGSAGVAAHYTVKFYVPKGDTGAADTTILDATDISGTPTAGYALTVNPTHDGIVFSPTGPGALYTATTINSLASSNVSPRTIASIAVPGQLRAWRPKVLGEHTPINAADTRVDLLATIGTTSGDQVGYAQGKVGTTADPLQLIPNFGTNALGSSGGQYGAGYGLIPAGQATTVFVQAKQIASSTSNWSTSNVLSGFTVEVAFVP
jgi:hypothetical protein